MKKKILFLGMILALSGCYSVEERQAAVLKRAAYDLSCEEKDIKLTELQVEKVPIYGIVKRVKFGAEGCGQKKVYDNIDDKVYSEGAAPNPVVINSPVYTAPAGSVYSPPYRP